MKYQSGFIVFGLPFFLIGMTMLGGVIYLDQSSRDEQPAEVAAAHHVELSSGMAMANEE